MKRLSVFILSLLAMFSISVTDVKGYNFSIINPAANYNEDLPRVVDDADLLSDSEEEKLEDKIEDIIDEYEFDVVIVTVDSTDGKSIRAFADDYFDYGGTTGSSISNSYGYGKGCDGMIIVVNMGTRDWWISTHGYGTEAFTDYGTDTIGDYVADELGDGDYYDAFDLYLDLAEEFLEQAENGRPYDTNNKYETSGQRMFQFIIGIVIAIVAGLIVAAIVVGSMKRKMNTVNKKYQAKEYIGDNQIHMTYTDDRFIRTDTRRVKIETSSSGGSGGGTSTHRSSSGRSHGGSGGRF